MCYSENVGQIRTILAQMEHEIKCAQADLDYCDKKTQDILHVMELEEHNHHEYARLAKELAGVRKARRVAKDAIETLEPLMKWKSEAAGQLAKLDMVIGKMRSLEEKQDHRIYYYRADNAGEIIGLKQDIERKAAGKS